MTDLEALALRCEGAGGADDDLAMAIVWLDYRTPGGIGLGCNYDPALWMQRRGVDPTASLDAAMSLVPAPGKWSITSAHNEGWEACVWLVDGLALDWRSAATPALALCAASLRAAALLDQSHD